MTNADIIVNLATMIAEQRLEISELKTEVEHLHHELIATMSEADTPQTEVREVCDRDGNCSECWKELHCRAKDTPQTERSSE